MNDQLTNIRLKFACPADWDSMQTVDGIKYCGHCQKNVYDFTDARVQEFAAILAANGNHICGRFRAEQMAAQPFILPAWKKWVSAALVLVGINIFGQKAEAQHPKLKIIKPNTAVVTGMPVLGFVDNQKLPEFPGGGIAFGKFLTKNIRFTKNMHNGKVIIGFDVNKDGSLSNFKILRSPGLLNENEVIRVLKLAPKWKPGTLYGKPVVTSYTIPVNFQR